LEKGLACNTLACTSAEAFIDYVHHISILASQNAGNDPSTTPRSLGHCIGLTQMHSICLEKLCTNNDEIEVLGVVMLCDGSHGYKLKRVGAFEIDTVIDNKHPIQVTARQSSQRCSTQ
jgi:hypothetical protein